MVKKKEQWMENKTMAGVVMLIVGAMLFIGTFGTFSLSGASVISIDNVKMASNLEGLDGNVYLATISMGGGEELIGEITPETIAQYGITTLPEGTFTIKFEMEEYSCNYNLMDDGNTIYKIFQYSAQNDLLTQQCPWNKATFNTLKSRIAGGHTTDGVQNTMIVGSPPDAEEVGFQEDLAYVGQWCYWTPEDRLRYNYVNGVLSSVTAIDPDGEGDWRATTVAGYPYFAGYKINTAPTMDYKIKVTLVNHLGEEISTYITPENKVSNLGDIARVKSIGNLLSDSFCGNPAIDYAVVKDISDDALHNPGTLKLVPKENYNAYKTQKQEFVALDNDRFTQHYQISQTWITYDPGIGGGPVWTYMSGLNNHLRLMWDYVHPATSEFSIVDEKVVAQPSEAPFIPMLQLIVKADWLGAKVVAGEPAIVDVTPPDFLLAGGLHYVQSTVKNIGDYPDEFQAYVKCGTTTNLAIRDSFAVGESKELSIPISAVNTGSVDCDLFVKSMNNPTAVDSLAFNAFVQQPVVISDLIELQRLVYERFVGKIDDYDTETLLMVEDVLEIERDITDLEIELANADDEEFIAVKTRLDNLLNDANIIYAKLVDLDGEIVRFQLDQEASVVDLREQTDKRLAQLELDAAAGLISATDLAEEKQIVLYQQAELEKIFNEEIVDRRNQVKDLISKIDKIKQRITDDIIKSREPGDFTVDMIGDYGGKVTLGGVDIPVPKTTNQWIGVALVIAGGILLFGDFFRRMLKMKRSGK